MNTITKTYLIIIQKAKKKKKLIKIKLMKIKLMKIKLMKIILMKIKISLKIKRKYSKIQILKKI